MEESVKEELKEKLKAHLRNKFTWFNEGTSHSHSRFEHAYTKLYITDQFHEFSSNLHEIHDNFKITNQKSFLISDKIELLNIFKWRGNWSQPPSAEEKPIRLVMMKGIAGIGKTVAVQDFALKWAEGKSHLDIDLVFVLPFRELNMLKEGEYSLLELLLHFYPELTALQSTQQLANMRVLFIFDGLDESRLSLDFKGGVRVSDKDERSTVGTLLTSLIKGDLLPDALIWITSRPAAADQIPDSYIDRKTEVQGFTEEDKEIYFRKRFSDTGYAEEVLSRLQSMISFYFMGHIPIFCWILAEVFREGWRDRKGQEITTMTELYVHYLIIQVKRTKQKYGVKGFNERMRESQDADMLLNLSKLAFEHLQTGNIIFYEEDLRNCGINVDEASLFCGFCSEILKEERGLYQQKVFSFVHLSFQEFLAALHVFHCCVTNDSSSLASFLGVEPAGLSWLQLQEKVVDKALRTQKGQWDLFVCFFLGLSLDSNQTMLQKLLPQTKSPTNTVKEMKMYLQNFHIGDIPKERWMNIFFCKLELKEEKFLDDVQLYLNAGVTLYPIDCVVLDTMLRISGGEIEELDLTNCFAPLMGAEKVIQHVKNSKKAVLKCDDLVLDCHKVLVSILQSADSCLRELHLQNSFFSAFDILSPLLNVLECPTCKLEKLRLSGFPLDFRNCQTLFSVLQSKKSPLKMLDLANCIYDYPKDNSGFEDLVDLKINESYEHINDELTPLTVIVSALIGPICRLEEFRMPGCLLKSKCCQVFASALCSNSRLKELDLSHNDLQDLGVQLLSVGLGSGTCRLQILRLSCCGITEDGCMFLASALKSNPSHLRELDLSYNYPGEQGRKLLSERLQDPECRLEKLNVDHNEEHWVNPQLLTNFSCDLTFDPDTINVNRLLSEDGRTVSHTEEKQPYPDHPERFEGFPQLLCREALTGRAYWEVEWEGLEYIGVAYKSVPRKPTLNTKSNQSDKTWYSSAVSNKGYSFKHGPKETFRPIPYIDVKAFQTRSKKLGLFLDWPAGNLSFYWLSGETKTLLHTYHTSFTEPLFPAFTVYRGPLTLSTVGNPNMHEVRKSFMPEVKEERTGVTYRFEFPGPGLFQCSLTDLLFSVTHEGEVTYKMLIWDQTQLDAAQKVPGGPLFSITCPQDSISQLHFPHCEPEAALVSESLSVAHITDDGTSFIKPLEVNETHVVVDVLHLSALGLVWDYIKRFVEFMVKPIRGQVLMFIKPIQRSRLVLWVLLLPSNVPLHEVKAQRDSEYIQAPSFCLLHKGQYYSLHSQPHPQDFTIQPPRAEFFANYGPNYHPTFEIVMSSNLDQAVVMLQQDQEEIKVWEHNLHLPAVSVPASTSRNESCMPSTEPAKEKLFRVRSVFVQQVSDPVLNKLLDELLHHRVINGEEDETLRAKPRADKARDLIDTVRNKGNRASSLMIEILAQIDPYRCSKLGLS